MIDTEFPGRVLLCEANELPQDVRAYFGDGDEFQMAFHFPLMPRLFIALGRGQAEPLRDILERTPSIPANCQWSTFLRNHDELTLEMVTPEERGWMWEHYAPEPRMRLNLGIRRRLAPLLENDRRRIELMHSLLFTWPGAPILYYGDEIGMGDNIWLPDRNGVRTPMQWSSGLNAGFTTAGAERLHAAVISDGPYGPERVNVEAQMHDAGSLWHAIRRLLAVRRSHTALSSGHTEWVDLGNAAVAALRRSAEGEGLLLIHNLSPSEQTVQLPSDGPLLDLVSGGSPVKQSGSLLLLEPFGYRWLGTGPTGAALG